MNQKLFYIGCLALVTAIGWMVREQPEAGKEYFPVPGHTQVREKERGDEQEERDRFEQWYEYMHKCAPGTDWRKMDAETRQQKYAERYRSRHIPLVCSQETLANGNLVGEWKERGSVNCAGRIWVADLDTATGAVYCGSDGGNVWKGDMNGSNWAVLNDKLKFDIKMIRVIPNGSGTRIITAGGRYVYYSDDDGITWLAGTGLSNLASWGYIKRGIILDDSLRTMYVLAYEWDYNNWWGITSVYKSTDKGASFSRIAAYDEPSFGDADLFDIWAPRYGTFDPSFVQNDSLFNIGRVSDSISFISNLPLTSSGYTLLCGYRDTADFVLYAYVDQVIYKSVDGGLSWNNPVALGMSPFGATSFSCSVTDPNNLYFGDIECHYSTDGGNNWTTVSNWWEYYNNVPNRLHADLPSITSLLDAQGNEFLFIGTDGGLYTSYNNLQTVQNISLNGLNVSQYYSVYTNKNDANYIYAGSQDQGFQRCQTDSGTGLGFDQVISGDYGHISSSDGGNSIWMNYPGFADYYANGMTGTSTATWNFNSSIPFWIPPIMVDRQVNNVCYLAGGNLNSTGSKIIQLVENAGVITPYEMPFNFQSASGGGKISAIASSPINDMYWYVLTDNGRFFRSSDYGVTWAMSTVTGLGANYLYGATIYPSQSTLGLVYVGGSGYSNSPVYRSVNHGQNFTAINTGLPNTHVFQLTGNYNDSLIFAATEVGPYVYVAAENTWYDMQGLGAPDQTYWSVEYVPSSNTVRFATYGRGIWDFKITSPVSGLEEQQLENSLSVYPNPARENFTLSFDAVKGKAATISIYSADGRQVSMKTIKTEAGRNSIPVDCSLLADGVYFVSLRQGEIKITRKLIVNN
ncbi:MAG: T9SS type A sorting domain-containing protein [Bacteroidota bacterium]